MVKSSEFYALLYVNKDFYIKQEKSNSVVEEAFDDIPIYNIKSNVSIISNQMFRVSSLKKKVFCSRRD